MLSSYLFTRLQEALVIFMLVASAGGWHSATAQPTLLFDWSAERCGTWDIPDTPARFWRDPAGNVHMISGSEENRSSTGPSLVQLTRKCEIIYSGSRKADPSLRDDRVWIASIFTKDGLHIEALGHAEFHGHSHPGTCFAKSYMSCWRNAIIALESNDGGKSFNRVQGPPVAALPYPYSATQTRRSGYFNPSNMIEKDGFVYVYVFAEAYGAQKRGVCLLRRPLGSASQEWRAWDGEGFERRLADPYHQNIADPEHHVCTPLPGLTATLSSVVRQPATGRYLAVSPQTKILSNGIKRSGIWAYTSLDLIKWEDPVLLAQMPLLWARDCSADAAYAYPALVDPESPARMLDTVHQDFWLTVVRMPLDKNCRVGPQRDLERFHVSWPERGAAQPGLKAPETARSNPQP